MRIIPAIDIIGGKCVRLEKGDYNKATKYFDDPVAVARGFEEAGLGYLHLVDLDGAKSGKVTNLKVLRSICELTALQVDFGGGIKFKKDIDDVLAAGAKQITVGSLAVKDREMVRKWIQEYGADRIILGADVLKDEIMVSGWQQGSGINLTDFLNDYVEGHKVKYVLCTDIDRDGMLSGPPIELYKLLLSKYPSMNLIASGGVSSADDLSQLSKLDVDGVVIGKAIYENKISLEELTKFDRAD